ncbi:MAG: NAD-dependent epimerase/dehydratase family protein [Planctomycetes bacterium]|nr:NAD-dependent epimerase/dehydratase family protein [Planctomycetota bacterium]
MKALVCGAGGFIGSHMVKRLIREGYWVRGVDLKYPEFSPSEASDFIQGDLRNQQLCDQVFHLDGEPIHYDEVYQFAADMGGAGYIFTGENDANVMHNSALINLNMVERCVQHGVGKVFYSSSACIYPARNQVDPNNPLCSEDTAYPADPDSEYGWEKLFSERLYGAFLRNYGLNVRTARFHNIFGPEGTWEGGKEKAPAALCRKVIQSARAGEIEVWGSGKQTRSFLYIDECIEGVRRLMNSDVTEVINIGSEEMISINGLAELISEMSGKGISIKNIPGPEGVMGRNSDNRLIQELLSWQPSEPLRAGIERTYAWIEQQVAAATAAAV